MTIKKDSDFTNCPKAWTTLITNTAYLPGLLNLDYSLKKVGSKYPLVALYTDTFGPEGHAELDARNIPKLRIEYLLPVESKDYSNDTRFYDCWTKLQPFSLVQFERVVQIDSDMLVVQNMDELMELDLGNYDFAATHACVCNPYKKPHYPSDWIAPNCAYSDGNHQQRAKVSPHLVDFTENYNLVGPPATLSLGTCNGGLQVVNPSREQYEKIIGALSAPEKTSNYEFADQSLLSDVFRGNWLPLSYKYNALKTLATFHSDLWKPEEVKNIHYIITPKPWDVTINDEEFQDDTGTFVHWWEINEQRLEAERQVDTTNQS
ncbi:BA75_00240T0 [Komagataella pastoris]|uniref:BA75_00240T0 n=1 Tax=Komagataella pastoris TaxID=4922 RepID=A0A1B2J7J7_PICPA|nr:BA75_00240T0 [Komagataella pastoris]